MFEPINGFASPEAADRLHGFDVSSVADAASKLKAVYQNHQPADDPMFDFDERDLLALAERASFREVHLSFEADIEEYRSSPWQISWQAMLHSAFNPSAPTLEEAMAEALTHEERERLISHLRPLVDAGQGQVRRAAAYLWSVR